MRPLSIGELRVHDHEKVSGDSMGETSEAILECPVRDIQLQRFSTFYADWHNWHVKRDLFINTFMTENKRSTKETLKSLSETIFQNASYGILYAKGKLEHLLNKKGATQWSLVYSRNTRQSVLTRSTDCQFFLLHKGSQAARAQKWPHYILSSPAKDSPIFVLTNHILSI